MTRADEATSPTPADQPAESRMSRAKTAIQRFGGNLAGMVMPNIGAFIAWGLITALFIPTGWWPNETLAQLVDPMIKFLDRKSTRLNSSHVKISYAVFCLKK